MLKKQKFNSDCKSIFLLYFLFGLAVFTAGLNASENLNIKLSDEQYDKFILGKSFFTKPWVLSPSSTTARDGLGPLFNANTCISCHPSNARGVLYENKEKTITSRSLVARLSLENIQKNKEIVSKQGFIKEPVYGSQISINGTQNTKYEGNIKVNFSNKIVNFPDGEIVELLKPNYTLENLNYGKLHKNANTSYRMATSLYGLGLIEQIPNKEILANVDIEDKNNDGISGKANFVYSKITKKYELGKFNHKANVAFLKEQIANAANDDMGLTNSINPNDNCTSIQVDCIKESKFSKDIDIPDFRLEAIEFYIKNLTTKTYKKDLEYLEGLELFENIGCAKCHISSFKISENKKVSIYSDLLLHDMGEELSDGRVEFLASKLEFRTAPLMGISKNSKYLLHDGRARNIQEAILWHGGEAQKIKENYMNLEKTQRKKLLEFIEKL